MKFLAITLIVHNDKRSHTERFREVVDNAVLSHIAAKTSRIRLFTAVTTLSLLDPVRAFEDYALWREDKVTWAGRFRPALTEAETWPRPLQRSIRVWHGSATSKESVDLAAYYGDPLFSANVTNPIEPYADLIDHYRKQWVRYGHDPADALVGAGTAGYYAARTSQEAIETYRPIFDARLALFAKLGIEPVFATLEDAIERSSILVGSPQQIIDKVLRYHQRFGHEVMHLHADADGLTTKQHRDALELFQAEIAPVLRQEIPSRPFPGGAA
ncbi:LLM class flavin-dependent oxidoreductase [Nonomuraea sp. CA-143628]|uniref:LLM class flavin-dependent oxidoreductase n=1 Tax=Nonomuraea sp. CA-143628 TaxID=3239997 RepID=UPI003D906BF2